MKLILIPILILLYYTNSHAQKTQQDVQVLSYNIGLNGITAGVGAIINKHKDQTWYDSFFKGFYQGCIGGVCIYTGKSLAFQINHQQNYAYCWPSRIMYSAGTSIVENAALNNTFGENWNIDLWLFRLDVSLKNHSSCKVRFLLSSVYSLSSMYAFVPDAHFDLRRTVQTGTVVFSTNNMIESLYYGYTYGNSIAVKTNSTLYSEYHIVAHELIHTYQNTEYEIFNTWLAPLQNKVPDKVRMIFDQYIYFDVSYYMLFYELQGTYSSQYYYKNFYELEAEYFATEQFIPEQRW